MHDTERNCIQALNHSKAQAWKGGTFHQFGGIKAKEKILDQRSEESKGRENSRSRSKESKKTYKKVIGLDNV